MESIHQIWLGDNLSIMKNYVENEKKEEFADLIYIDPPFNSKRNYNIVFDSSTNTSEEAFTDIWSNVNYLNELEEIHTINPNLYSFLKNLEKTGLQKSMLSYLTAMGIRCYYMRKLLKPTGSFYYHCDPTASHYIKIVLDYVFGIKNFRNEIVWCYSNSGRSKTSFPAKHDIIFMYSKTDDYLFNSQKIEVSEEMQKQYPLVCEETGINYRMASRGKAGIYKEYALKLVEDWWTDINSIGGRDKTERLGYPTQKPEALLERIIKASSNEGDIVMDFYSGGGTTAAVCKKLNRHSIVCDINSRAIQITKTRLESLGCVIKRDVIVKAIPNNSKELKELVNQNILGVSKNSRFDLEDVTVKYYLKGVVGNDVKVGDNSIDGTFGFQYQGRQMKGLVQVTSGSNKNHLKAFCSEISKGTGDLGVYVCFKEDVTDGFVQEVKSYGKLGNVDKIQILTFEDLIDNNKQYQLP